MFAHVLLSSLKCVRERGSLKNTIGTIAKMKQGLMARAQIYAFLNLSVGGGKNEKKVPDGDR